MLFKDINRSVTINILGRDLKVKAGSDEGHIIELSRYISDKVNEVQNHGTAIDTMDLVALVMLNIADEAVKSKKEFMVFKDLLAKRIEKIVDQIDKIT